MIRHTKLLLLTVSLIIFVTETATAQEAAVLSKPAKAEADKAPLPSDESFEHLQNKEFNRAEELKEFFTNSSLTFAPRTFYFARADAADAPNNDKERISWAAGGAAKLKTGKYRDVFSINAELYTSQHLYGPLDKDGALLLESGQDSYTTIGVANPRFEYDGHLISAYRQRHDLPYVNSQDNRMTPNTFEDYGYAYIGEGKTPPVQFAIAYLDKIKKRNEDDFISMSEAAGVSGDEERGMPWAALRLRPTDQSSLFFVNYAGLDFLNIFYSDADITFKPTEKWSFKSSVQFTEQRSMGDDLLTGESFSTAMYGFQQSASYGKLLFRTAVTSNDKGALMRSPFGTYPGYNCGIVDDFNRAGELAWKVGTAYDFSEIGVDGLSTYFDYISGNGSVDDDHNYLNDKSETDLNIDYKIAEGLLQNLWLRLRAGFVKEENVGTTEDYRVILNYEIKLL